MHADDWRAGFEKQKWFNCTDTVGSARNSWPEIVNNVLLADSVPDFEVVHETRIVFNVQSHRKLTEVRFAPASMVPHKTIQSAAFSVQQSFQFYIMKIQLLKMKTHMFCS